MTTKPFRAILVEADDAIITIIRNSFKDAAHEFELTVTRSIDEARRVMGAVSPDLVISDLRLPDGEGIQLLTAEGLMRNVPLVLILNREDEQHGIEGIRAGVLDYVIMSEKSLKAMPRIAERAMREWRLMVERERAEAALAESEDKYRLLFENANEAIIVAQDGKLQLFNPKVTEISGYSAEELKAKPLLELIHPDDQEMVYDRYTRRLKGEKVPNVYAFRIIDKKGATKWVDINAVRITWNGRPASLNFLDDITERKRTEEALSVRNLQYENFVDSNLIGIWRVEFPDPISVDLPPDEIAARIIDTGVFTDCNDVMARMYGLETKQAFIGKTIREYIVDRKRSLERIGKMVENHFRAVLLDTEEKDENGAIRYFRNSYFGHVEEGLLLWFWGIQIDITEQMENEAKIRASLNEKELLLKEIHHRVKNNMQVISSLLNLQARRIKDRDAIAAFDNCRDRVRSMALIHERLYRSEELSRVDFHEYLRSLVNELYRAYGMGSGKVKLQIDAKHTFLPINLAIPCGLIANELVSNALKHAFPPEDEKEGLITIILDADGDTITLSVIDNGTGMPDGFDMGKTDSLGLNLVSMLVEDQLQGVLHIEDNDGTRFVIQFEIGDQG